MDGQRGRTKLTDDEIVMDGYWRQEGCGERERAMIGSEEPERFPFESNLSDPAATRNARSV